MKVTKDKIRHKIPHFFNSVKVKASQLVKLGLVHLVIFSLIGFKTQIYKLINKRRQITSSRQNVKKFGECKLA